jgi:hypothetical protein
MLKVEPLPYRVEKLQTLSRPKLKVAVGLLTGHTTLRVHMFKLGLTPTGFPTAGTGKMRVCISFAIVWLWCAKNTEAWVMFLKPKDLENIRVSSFVILVTKKGLACSLAPFKQ